MACLGAPQSPAVSRRLRNVCFGSVSEQACARLSRCERIVGQSNAAEGRCAAHGLRSRFITRHRGAERQSNAGTCRNSTAQPDRLARTVNSSADCQSGARAEEVDQGVASRLVKIFQSTACWHLAIGIFLLQSMRRRHFLYGAAFALASPAVHAQSARERTLRLVPLTSLYSLDTVFNTSLVTTNHGWAVYNSLFGMNSKGEIKPQMAEGYTLSDDGSLRDHSARRPQISQWRARPGTGLSPEPEAMDRTGDFWPNDCAVHR